MDARDALAPAEVQQNDTTLDPDPPQDEQAAWPPYQRPGAEQLAAVLRLAAEGFSCRRISEAISLPYWTVWRTLRKFKSTADAAKALLHAGALEAMEAWTERAIPKAAARGDHRPAMDLLKAAKVIDDTPQMQQTLILGGWTTGTSVAPLGSRANPWQGVSEAKVVNMQPLGLHNGNTTPASD